MGKFFKSCFSGLVKSVVPWLLFGLLIPILFFAIHPFDPIVVFGGTMTAVGLFFLNKWSKEMPAAKKATEEAEKAGEKFVDIHPTDEMKESPVKRFKNKFYPMLFTSLISASMLSCRYNAIYQKLKSQGRMELKHDSDGPPQRLQPICDQQRQHPLKRDGGQHERRLESP